MSDGVSFPTQIPEDCQLVSVTGCAAALGTTERKARAILAAENIPTVELGARTHGVRLSCIRELLTRREVHTRATNVPEGI